MHRIDSFAADELQLAATPSSTKRPPIGSPPGHSDRAGDVHGSEFAAAQQMSNVGLLAAGLAHDLNNLLTVILGSAELARDQIPEPSLARHHLNTIETTVRRAGDLCRAMLACARTDHRQVEPIDANALVRDTVALLQSSRLALHRVRMDLGPDLPSVQANPAQFRQVVLNLLANAAEACGPRGGRIRVSTSVATIDARAARRVRPTSVEPGKFLRLRVTDDGCGMDEATQQRLFTPFFTHKGPGRGLGLASLLEIVRAHRGGVRVFSEPARGAIFDVFLPLLLPAGTTASAPDAEPPRSPPSADERMSGSVLLADDEEVLRQSLAMFLQTQGLTVHAMPNGEAALACLKEHPEIDLILIDLVMPKLSGIEVLTELRSDHRFIPAILMTGHADVSVADQLAGLEPTKVLEKPFSLVDLMRLVGELLPQRR